MITVEMMHTFITVLNFFLIVLMISGLVYIIATNFDEHNNRKK